MNMFSWKTGPYTYRRRPTRQVMVGAVGVGGDNPIRVQSMTTPSTQDTAATVEQIERLVGAGCEIVRLTVPTRRDAENLSNIRAELNNRGIQVPLVADIHFTPAAAMQAADFVEKVRVNPGNYADRKKFQVREYTDREYDAELERIRETFSPLVLKCRDRGISMRIGTNHGSLSDRILNRFGDTPEGMVESALEFVRICESLDYRELILSMKASNPVVVLEAYRLLVAAMDREDMHYPLHLGVTEAGDGEDARIKSAIGIGALLEEGIGDTIRVSLTEDPVREIPVALAMAAPYNRPGTDTETGPRIKPPVSLAPAPIRPGERRSSRPIHEGPCGYGGRQTVRVDVVVSPEGLDRLPSLPAGAGEAMPAEWITLDLRNFSGGPGDARAVLEEASARIGTGGGAPWISTLVGTTLAASDHLPELLEGCRRLHWTGPDGLEDSEDGATLQTKVFKACARSGAGLLLEAGSGPGAETGQAVAGTIRLAGEADRLGVRDLSLAVNPCCFPSPLLSNRLLADRLGQAGLDLPIVLLDRPQERGADPRLGPGASLGGLLCEGIGDSLQLALPDPAAALARAYDILQAARLRITRTDYISCPSCGRTLFDLESTTARIKKRTSHLKGLKIGIMGCIVNGPGEMADADFGYVGWGEGKIALFVGHEMVAKEIPEAEADDRLVELIRAHGRWVDPEPSS